MSLAHAWDWSKRRSPLARLMRFVLRRPGEVERLVDAAELPDPCADLVRSVVRRTRLWPGEKADVARELIDHVHDALAAEHAPEQIVEQFGDPVAAAKLIRRARKRQRHPLLRAWTAAVKLTVFSPLILLGLYGILWIRFHAGDPTIATNYAAQVEASWPDPGPGRPPYETYELAVIRWNDLALAIDERAAQELGTSDWTTTPANDLLDLDPRHPFYNEVVEAFRVWASELDTVADAAARPGHGMPIAADIHPGDDYLNPSIDPEQRLSTLEPIPDNPVNQAPLWAVLLPHLGWMRINARLLVFDARLAIAAGDAERFIARTGSAFDLARQSSTDGFLISGLVAQAIHGLACREVGLAMRDHAIAFNDAQLAALAHAIDASAERAFAMSFEVERVGMHDVLQRSFTDNGSGGGRLTNESYANIAAFGMSDFGPVPDTFQPSTGSRLAAPVLAPLVAGRRAQYRLFEEQAAVAEHALAQGPAAMPAVLEAERRFAEHMRPFINRLRYFATAIYTPALGGLVGNTFKGRAISNATLAAIAIESFRRDEGRPPAALIDLVPRYLPAVPEDPFAPGEPLRFAILGEIPLIYSVGQDADDDGGTPAVVAGGDRADHSFRRRYGHESTDPATGRRMLVPLPGRDGAGDGDWVLFPPADD